MIFFRRVRSSSHRDVHRRPRPDRNFRVRRRRNRHERRARRADRPARRHRGPRSRLSARDAGRRAHLRGDRRHLAGRRSLHDALLPQGDRRQIRRPAHPRLRPSASGHQAEALPLPDAALPARRRASPGRGLRPDRLVVERLRPRHPTPIGRRARLLLPHAVPLRLARARNRARRGARGGPAPAAQAARPDPALGPRGLRAGHALRRQLAPGAATDRAHLRARVGRHPPARRG